MITGTGSILSPVQSKHVTAIQSTSRSLDAIQLALSTGKRVNSALDNPQNFFASLSLQNRASDLNRLLDGIAQSIRSITLANDGIKAALKILDQTEAHLKNIESRLEAGETEPLPPGSPLAVQVQDVLNANPEAIHLGGGVITHTYTTTGTVTFTPPSDVTEVDYLIVGGGGGGGTSTAFGTAGAGGGGGGGVLTGSITVSNQAYDVVVGAGGSRGAAGNNSGSDGGNSSFGLNTGTNLTALGGGGGIGGNGVGGGGGSGGGGRGGVGGPAQQPGTPQGGSGNIGGGGTNNPGDGGGGGGGAGAIGGDLTATGGGNGGDGISSSITGTPGFYGAGGGGGGANGDSIGLGGNGGGGNGANDGSAATAGTANTGGGGGGGNNSQLGSNGGSGIVVLSYQLTGAAGRYYTPAELEYIKIVDQLEQLSIDANYRGVNLLRSDDLVTEFNEDRTNILTTEGFDLSDLGLELGDIELRSLETVRAQIDKVRDARNEVRNYNASIATDLSIISTRETSIHETVNNLKAGSDDLTIADQNEVGAEFLALQTRQQMQFSVLSISAQAQGQISNLISGLIGG